MSRFYVSKFYKCLDAKHRRGIENCFHFKKLVNFIIHYKSAEVLLYPCVKGYNGGIIARWLSLITAHHFLIREGLEYFSVLCYNGYSKKSTSGWSLRLAWGGVGDMRFKVWPQSWPFTGLDYVGILDFVARKSTVFGQKSTEKHAKWGKKPMLLRLGRRCRRFESCHSDQFRYS